MWFGAYILLYVKETHTGTIFWKVKLYLAVFKRAAVQSEQIVKKE